MPGDAFIDVGAHIGYYSLLASKLVGETGKVVAIEALPQLFSMLEDNLKTNCARNIRAVNVAAWDVEGLVSMFTRQEAPAGQTTLMEAWASQWQLDMRCAVPAAPLSVLLKPDEIKAARLIKIDVEGAEWRVISGMASWLHACRMDLEIIVEVTPKLLQTEGRTCQDLLDFFSGFGFYPYRIENNYSAKAYFARVLPSRPERIDLNTVVKDQSDIVFSRINAASLS
jgi:FkbM family methyltransferase